MKNTILEKEKKRRKMKTFFQCENQKNRTFLLEKKRENKESEETKEQDMLTGHMSYLTLMMKEKISIIMGRTGKDGI